MADQPLIAHTLQEADPAAVLAAMGELMTRCHACHSAYRLR